VPQIKLDLLEIGAVQVYADRSVDVQAVDRVRGPIVIRMQEDAFRWLWAQTADIVPNWRDEDGED